MSKKISYYVTGNTAEGMVDFLPSNIEGIDHVIVLKHRSNTLKTSIIKHIIEKLESTNDMEILLSPLGNKYLEGVIIREKSLAVVTDATSGNFLNLPTEFDLSVFVEELPDNDQHTEINRFTQTAYENFATGLKIHDSLESIFINQMNFERADEVANEFIEKIVEGAENQNRPSHIYHRLFGTNTADGVVNVVRDLLDGMQRSYFIKGRAGTGKSTFMKKVLATCMEYGFDIELYHCSFDPNSIDMVLVRDLGFCIFDSTDPHEFFPERDGEEVIDMYAETVAPGTDEQFAEKIASVNAHYKSYMKKGIENLKNAGIYLEKSEARYDIADDDVKAITTTILIDLI